MATQLKILIVEDVPNDAELALRELKRSGIAFDARRVDTASEYRRELEQFKPQLILADFSMPHFDGLEALAIARNHFPDIPFIFVSGSIGEEDAIRAMKQGANDYVMKTNLVRLAAAVERAIQEQKERTARRNAEDEVRETRNFLASIFDNIPNMIFVKDAGELRFVRLNPAGEKLIGYSEKELLGKNDYDFFPKDQADFFVAKDRETLTSRERLYVIEETITAKDGTRKILQTKKLPILGKDGSPRYLLGFSEDITERKQAELRLRESEERFRQVAENIREVFWLTDPSKNEMLYISPTYEGIWGRSRQSLYAAPRTWAEAIHLEDRDRVLKAAQTRQMAGEYVEEYRIVRPDGTMRWIRDRAFPVPDTDGNVIRIAGIAEDITERKEQEHRIARLSRIQLVLSGINSAIVRIRDRQELFREACRIAVEHGRFSIGWIAKLDHAAGTLVPVTQMGLPMDLGGRGDSSNRPVGLVPGGTAEVALREKRPAFDNDIERGLDEVGSELEPDTLSVRRAAIRLGAKSVIVLPLYVEGKTFAILTLYAPERNFFDDEEIKLLTELAGDISFGLEFISKEEEVNYLAYYDVLTKLPNRTLLEDRLGQYLHAAQRGRRMAAVMLIDLERFHVINDTLGRSAADNVLREIASRLQLQIRTEDTVARVGADCFAIALSDAGSTAEVAHAVHERVFAFLKQPPVRIGDQDLRPSAKFGVAVFPSDGSTAEVLYSNAEAALKNAKASGERFLFYAPEMNARVAESLTLENKLRSALDQGQFVLYYQPKVSMRGRKVVGFEALIRWKDPELGLVPPAKFIPFMEETGLILDVGRWALSQVAHDCGLWLANGAKAPRVAVNVSSIQLRQKNFVDIVIEAAEKTRKADSMLDLEITESVIMENVEAIIKKLQTIRELGVEIAVDDFGTGYSSLAYVAKLPIHDLKIDRSFIVGMTGNQDSLAIVKSVISLAHALRLNVVAEGVETEEQAALLLKLGCDEMQGYLISPPVSPDKVPGLLSRQKSAAIRPARRRSRKSPAR